MADFIVETDGIYKTMPGYGEGIVTLVLPKEVFVEAYNKYIRDATSRSSKNG